MLMGMRALLFGLVLVCMESPVRGQTASPWLPADHWTRSVMVWLHARDGEGADPAVRLHTYADAQAALRDWYARRLAAERAAPLAGSGTHIETALLFVTRTDAVRPSGYTLEREWTGPQPTRDIAAGAVRVRAEAVPRSWLALTTELTAAPRTHVVQHATITAAFGRFDFWAGRRAVGYRPGAAGGLVLHGVERFDGAGMRLARPVDVPLLGRVTGEAFAGPLPRNGHVDNPWLLGMRVHARLHPRLDAGATRAAVFGALDGSRAGLSELIQVIVGANLGGDHADDQVASIDARWRPPVPAVPVELYGEWAIHDIDAEVFIDVPAFTVGARLPRVLRAAGGEVGIGLEHTQISGSCCGNPPWYHHFELADGWSAKGRLLGHPLGGHGREWRATITGAAVDGAVLLNAAAAFRTRGAENVFAPARQGSAALFDITANFHIAERLSADMRLGVERGSGWGEIHTAAALRWTL